MYNSIKLKMVKIVKSRLSVLFFFLALISLASCEHSEHAAHQTGVLPITNPVKMDTILFEEYVCQIHSYQHIELRALEKGYLQEILVDEGQRVAEGKLLFQIQPTIYKAEVDKCQAEVSFAEIEYQNTKALADSNIVSVSELALAQARLEKARAELQLAETHLEFTRVRAPFNGIIGKFEDVRLGSLLDEGELLTKLSDNSKMWVYFNVPEATYLDYMNNEQRGINQEVKLRLANGKIFPQVGIIETIESDFNNTTGNIAFRATFSNPSGLLRHGQTGTILWPKEITNKIVIPQKATFEVLDKKFVYVVDEEGVIESKEIKVANELDHIYLLDSGLSENERILIDGLRKVRSGNHIAYEFVEPEVVFSQLKLHAE